MNFDMFYVLWATAPCMNEQKVNDDDEQKVSVHAEFMLRLK
jgi:hypothetical protein